MRRLTLSRRRLAACWSCSARLSSRLVAGTAGSAANRSIKPFTITWASRSTSGSTAATGWSGRTLGVPPRRAMLVSTPHAGLLGRWRIIVSSSHLDRVGGEEAGQVAAVGLPVLAVEAGRIGLQTRRAGMVGGEEMVPQLPTVLQEDLPGVQVGA